MIALLLRVSMLNFSKRLSARVLYLLSTQFHLPPTPTHHTLLTSSLSTYRQALTLTQDPLLESDTAYNLAIGLIEWADLAEDFVFPGITITSGVAGLGEQGIERTRIEARELLEKVCVFQQAYLSTHPEDSEENPDLGQDAEMNIDEEADEGPSSNMFETHIPTPSSLLDTLLLIVDLDISLLGALDPDLNSAILTAEPTQIVIKRAQALLREARKVDTIGLLTTIKESELATVLLDMGILFDPAVDSPAVISKEPEAQLIVLRQLKERLDGLQPQADSLDVDTKLAYSTALSNLHGLVARVATPWEQLSSSITITNKALALPFSILTNPLSQASLSLDLGHTSLRRAFLAIETNSQRAEVAVKNLAVLLKNAETYTNRALTALSWASLASEAASGFSSSTGGTLSIGLSSSASSSNLPPTQGWDHERLGRSAVLTLLRTLWYSSSDMFGPTHVAPAGAQDKGAKLLSKIKALKAERRIDPVDVERFVEEFELEEGGLRDEEALFWNGVKAEVQEVSS
jgi:hypothetical protein